MHYLTAEGLTKSYGIQPLFKDLRFHINEGEKIALVARNGSGKSTLLNILAGIDEPDEGKVWLHKDVQVILFEQDPHFDETKTVIENIFQHDHPVLNAIKQYESAIDADDATAIGEALIKMDELSAWDFEAKVKQILGTLKIHHFQQSVSSLSGGQRKRVALARTLIEVGFEPVHTLLIMDEPTNHLDVEMVEWLEHFLDSNGTTLLMVTHDRYFLDAVCNEIWELDGDMLYAYKGNYANYLEKKAQRAEMLSATIEKAKNVYVRELDWMRRQPQARTTKSKSRIDNFYEIEKVAKQRIQDQHLQLQVKMSRLGGKIAELKKINKSYGEKLILKGFDYTFSKGERIGIIGKNGVGKSTFLNILLGLEQADSGKINIGDTVVFGNFSQQGLQFKEDMRVIEYVKSFAETFPLEKGGVLTASQFLELFLFTGDKQYTYLSKLSGGEKKRLQLLTILFRNPNFLILDEPTNDLDLPTLSVLESFLSDYPGCVMIVSHDRYFMDRLVDHLFVFEGEGVIRDYPGNYSQYRESKKAEERLQQERLSSSATVSQSNSSENANGQTVAVKRKLSFKEQKEFDQLSKDLADLEKEKAALTLKMASGITDYVAIQQMGDRMQEIVEAIDEKELRWLELSELAN